MNNDLISREALLHEIGKLSLDWEYGLGVKDCLDLIDNAPTVETYTEEDAKQAIKDSFDSGYEMAKNKYERPQGEWIFVFDDKVNNRFIYKCSECGREVSVYSSDALIPVYPFCHCGAKMRKGGAE